MTIDRYQLTLDCRPFVRRWALHHEQSHWWHVPQALKADWRAQTSEAFARIEAKVRFVAGEEPYASAQEMRSRVIGEGVFLVREVCLSAHCHHPLGPWHKQFRAVHDWFGHVMHVENNFDMAGELGAWRSHRDEGVFSADVLPLVWSEVVLENAYRLYHGHWYRWYKPVFDPLWGLVPELELPAPKKIPNCDICNDKTYLQNQRADGFVAIEACDTCSFISDIEAARRAREDGIACAVSYPCHVFKK